MGKPNKTKRGYAKKYRGSWLGVTYSLALTGWSNLTGINRSYIENRLAAGMDFQDIIAEREPKQYSIRNSFLYGRKLC
jgi:hypothetical protein